MAGGLRLVSVTKNYGSAYAVRDLSLEVDEGHTCVLIGPSGCGKTTTLKMINRLVEPTSGHIFVDGRDVTSADPVELRRHIGYVIQHAGLFPHRTVAANVATVPALLGWDRARTASRVDELLELVGLPAAEFAPRYPHELSGGQQQRVGVARAMAADPPLLLLDEPFGAVDPITRHRLQREFVALQQRVGKTAVFVTHDLDEAILVGDRVAVLRDGQLEQYDTPARLLAEPASPFVAQFVGDDRAIKRLAVGSIDPATGAPPPTKVAATASLYDALAAMLLDGTDAATVVDGDTAIGVLTRARVLTPSSSS
jgi:osmoprotectant transport system ATP-binding protein